MVQNKAPIRSQTPGRTTLGEHRIRSTGQREGNSANRSSGQIGPMFRSNLRLSIVAVAPTADRRFDPRFGEPLAIANADVLGAPE
jgi:hypothetical protein